MSTISDDELRRRLALDQSEKVLCRLIRQVDWPFLGLFGEALNASTRKAVFDTITGNRSVAGFVRSLDRYPAVFSVYLCRVLMQTFGQADRFQLWPEIQKALRLLDLPNGPERRQLWAAFRRACLTLGLEVSPREEGSHYMVDEFLRQVGLAVSYAEDLARAMLRFAESHGLPEEDDPQGMIAWQEALIGTLNTPFSTTARAAVELDCRAYYTQAFLKVVQADGRLQDCASLLEKSFAKGWETEGSSSRRLAKAAIPQVVLQNDVLGVLLPGGLPREWTVDLDGVGQKYRTSGTEQFIPLESCLPLAVDVSDEAGRRLLSQTLWGDNRNNRILLFSSETGLLRARASLGDEPIGISPGSYALVSRFDPELKGMESEHLSDDPDLYLTQIQLSPGQRLKLQRGPAALVVAASSEAMVRWEGRAVVSREGHTLYPDSDLSLQIEVPTEILGHESKLEVELSVGVGGGPRVLSVILDENGVGVVAVGSVGAMAGWRPGLWRMLAQLRRAGEARPLARSASLCWIGLRGVASGLRFVCKDRPTNLFQQGCDNASVNDREVACRDMSRRSMRLVFALGAQREIALSWAVPGVFADLLTYDDQGLVLRKPLPLGSLVLASTKSSEQLVISADERGTLKLGSFERRVDFTRRGSVTLPLGTLADNISADSNRLTYQPEGASEAIPLIHLTRPHEVLAFETRLETGRAVMHFATAEAVETVEVSAQELLAGEKKVVLAGPTVRSPAEGVSDTASMLMTRRDDGTFSTNLLLDVSSFGPGAWLLQLQVRQDGLWGRLTNRRGDYYAAGIVVGTDGRTAKGTGIGLVLRQLGPSEVPKRFARFHEALQYCYAKPAWDSVQWLYPAWRAFLDLLADQGQEGAHTLLKAAATRPPDSASLSWIPQLTVLGHRPDLLALPAVVYAGLPARESPVTASLCALSQFPDTLALAFQTIVHPGLVGAFDNAAAICVGRPPRGFSVEKYQTVLRQTDDPSAAYLIADDGFLPTDGEFLGPVHYRFAKRVLEDRYVRSLGGNEIRRGRALWLAREVHRRVSRLSLTGQSLRPVLDPWPIATDDSTPQAISQKASILLDLEHFLSVLAWHCRLEVRRSGSLSQFLSFAKPGQDALESPLGFLLHVGEALIAFYLVLWEVVLRADLDAKPDPGSGRQVARRT